MLCVNNLPLREPPYAKMAFQFSLAKRLKLIVMWKFYKVQKERERETERDRERTETWKKDCLYDLL